MTQIVGIVCKESIIVASESQYTIGNWKQSEQQKMDEVTFKDENQASIAFAGSVSSALRVIHLMKENSKERILDNKLAVVTVAQEAIAKYRREVLAFYNQKPDLSPDEQDKIFKRDDRFFKLVIAHYHGDKPTPYLYTIDVCSGEYRRFKDYTVIGSASPLATAMLSQFPCNEMKSGEAWALAIDALERIKETDLYCGGQVRVAELNPKGFDRFKNVRVSFLPPEHTDRIVEKLRALRAENAQWYRNKFAELMKQIQQEDYEQIKKQIEAEFGTGTFGIKTDQ
jgi:20S proteasome alpha/beta subunit